jgi:ATP-binding cassette, subfamily B, heavy metal transporter
MSDAARYSEAEARRSGRRTIRKVMPYLWPEGQPWVKRRVVARASRAARGETRHRRNPFFYKAAVDALAQDAPTPGLGAGRRARWA